MHIPSYSEIYNIGHKALEGFFDDEVECTLKLDGSQISFTKQNGQYFARSKGQDLHLDNPEKLFTKGCEVIKTLDLKEGWIYRGEYFNSPRHNTITYERIPNNHIILYGIDRADQDYLSWEEMKAEGDRVGLEVVPLLFRGKIDRLDFLKELLDKAVCPLGGKIKEGIVLKQFNKFGRDKKILMAKFVDSSFKEVHGIEWKKNNPTKSDIVEAIIKSLQTDARYNKAVQHLNEKDQISGELKDIGALIKEVKEDILKEETENIKDLLFNSFKEQILRGASAPVPNWYKEKLAKTQLV